MSGIDLPIYAVALGQDWFSFKADVPGDVVAIATFGTREEAEFIADWHARKSGRMLALYRIVELKVSNVFEASAVAGRGRQ